MQTFHLPQFTCTYLKLLKYSTKQLKKIKSVFMIFHIYIHLFFYSQVFLPMYNQDFKIFLNLSEMHISEAEKLAASMTRENTSVYFLHYKCYFIFPQSNRAFALLILSVFFTVLQSEVLGTLCKELKLNHNVDS